MSNFGAYARYYDLLYRDKDYAGEVDYVTELIRKHAPGAASVLELGCGTGLHACLMAGGSESGYSVRGIDMSMDMLDIAHDREARLAADVRARVSFEHGDVRTYRCDRVFDAVVSLFHVFSYQTSNADLVAVFETASAHLRLGGMLLCDFWYGPAVLAQRPEARVKRLQDDEVDIVRIAEPVLHHTTNLVDVHYDIKIIDRATSTLQTVTETHRLRYLFLPELQLIAERSALQCVGTYRWLTQESPDEDAWSVAAVFVKQ